MSKKAILFINGLKPTKFDLVIDDELIGCTDGAFNYMKDLNITPHFVLGDFDSIDNKGTNSAIKFIKKENQNKTDFEKALEYLIKNGIKNVSIFGASGLEQDHFLGNISVALEFKKQISIIFFDDYGKYFFAKKSEKIKTKIGVNFSLFPIGKVKNISTKGLEFQLKKEDLSIGKRIGIRNKTIKSEIEISFDKGNLLLFVGN